MLAPEQTFKDNEPFKAPMKQIVMERPPEAISTPSKVSETQLRDVIAADGSFGDRLGDDEESEGAPSDDNDDEDSDYALSQDEDDGLDEDEPHIDDLLMSREIALEYHKKRFQMAGNLGPENAHLIATAEQEVRDSLIAPSKSPHSVFRWYRRTPLCYPTADL